MLMSFINVNGADVCNDIAVTKINTPNNLLPFESYLSEVTYSGETYNIKAGWINNSTISYKNVNLHIAIYASDEKLIASKMLSHSFRSEETYEFPWQFQSKVPVKSIKLFTWDSDMSPYIPALEKEVYIEQDSFESYFSEVTYSDETYTIKAGWINNSTNFYENVNLHIAAYDFDDKLIASKMLTHSFKSAEIYEFPWHFQCKVPVKKIKLFTWDSHMKPYIPALEKEIYTGHNPFESYFSEVIVSGETYNVKADWTNKTIVSCENVNLHIAAYDFDGKLIFSKMQTHSFKSEETYKTSWQFQSEVPVKSIKLFTWDSYMSPYIPATEMEKSEFIVEFSQMNDKVTDYLSEADNVYTNTNSSILSVMKYYETYQGNKDRPDGFKISTPDGILYILDEATGTGYEQAVSNGTYIIRNTIPNKTYRYLIKDSNGTLIDSGRIRPTGKVRMLYFEYDATNSRDLGGWECDGGTVKYGKLFRSAAISNNDAYHQPRNATIASRLGIRHHIDLRNDNEAGWIKSSSLGADVNYERITLKTYYKYIIEKDGKDYETIKKIMHKIMEAAVNDEPLIYNCSLGRDRTGTVTFMLLALLGVNMADLDKDYELTSFSSCNAWDNKLTSTYRTNGDLTGLVKYLNTLSGDTLRDKVINWFLQAGFSIEELNAFRNAMCDGTPDKLKSEDFVTP